MTLHCPPLVGDRLRRLAADKPDKPLYTYLMSDDKEPVCLTRGETLHRASALAGILAALGLRQRPVLLVYETGPEFAVAFLATLLAGAIAVPVPVPQYAAQFDRLDRIIADCDAGVILSTGDLRTKILAKETPLRSREWLATDAEMTVAAVEPGPVLPSDIALLQYTSGSTSEPKGVTLTHANVTHNLEMMAEAFGNREEDRIMLWLPHFHDMGLVSGILGPLIRGSDSILMPPRQFLLRPMRWLQAISDYRAQISGGPNFAYELCMRAASRGDPAALDLSSWSSAFAGAEPIRMGTLESFADCFRPQGFSRSALTPCYGMAEATLIVTCKPHGAPPSTYPVVRNSLRCGMAEPSRDAEALRLAGCGYPQTGTRLSIVDPERRVVLPPGRVGEVWIAGPQIANGYWNRQGDYNPFNTQLEDEEGTDWLRSGDLGFLTEEGELVFVDRLKDLIIVNGQNFACHDLELTAASSHDLLSPDNCVAVGFEAGDKTHIAIVAELATAAQESTEQLVSSIRASLFSTHSLAVQTIAFVPPRKLSRTTSGKLQRRLTLQRLSDGTLRPFAHYGEPLPVHSPLLSGDEKS